jgi:hypothetical protein
VGILYWQVLRIVVAITWKGDIFEENILSGARKQLICFKKSFISSNNMKFSQPLQQKMCVAFDFTRVCANMKTPSNIWPKHTTKEETRKKLYM